MESIAAGRAAAPGSETKIEVSPERFADQVVPAVSARRLHDALGIRKHFADWFPAQVERGRLIEGRDWIFHQKVENSSVGRPRLDYLLTVDAGKHIAMMCGSERGFAVREYFLECERRYRSEVPTVESLLEDPAALRKMLAGFAERTVESQAQIAELVPKAKFFDAVADSTNCQTIQDVAKVLGIGPNRLFATLRKARVLLPNNTPYQFQLTAGRFRVVEGSFEQRDGKRQSYTRTLVTGRGLAFIQKLIAEQAAA